MGNSLEIKTNIHLAPLTTLKIGGEARLFVRADSEEQVTAAVEYAGNHGLDLFVLGGGSNVLISDDGFNGLVLQIGLEGILCSKFEVADSRLSKDAELITAGAGEDWDEFVEYCVENDLAGVECLSGIPGLVGGTPVQNVGAYGQEVSETIVSVRCFDRKVKAIVTLDNTECGFSYRNSIFNSTERERYIVLSVTFQFAKGGEPKVVYKDLIEHFHDAKPTLRETREAVLAIRRAKSMVVDPDDPNSKSAGSFFKNPIVDIAKLDEMRLNYPAVPSFPFGDKVKIPAAWLIENAGFHKGFTLAGAGISTNHTLALINCNNATAREIIALKEKIQAGVFDKFGIKLLPEPVFIGF